MISLQVIVDLIEAGSDLSGVLSSEAKISISPKGKEEVVVGRAKHEGEGEGSRSTVCNQKIISRIAVQTVALESDLSVVRNKSFNALIGQHLDFYNAELIFEDGAIEDVVEKYANWIDVYRIEWSWDERGGPDGTGGPWGID